MELWLRIRDYNDTNKLSNCLNVIVCQLFKMRYKTGAFEMMKNSHATIFFSLIINSNFAIALLIVTILFTNWITKKYVKYFWETIIKLIQLK